MLFSLIVLYLKLTNLKVYSGDEKECSEAMTLVASWLLYIICILSLCVFRNSQIFF